MNGNMEDFQQGETTGCTQEKEGKIRFNLWTDWAKMNLYQVKSPDQVTRPTAVKLQRSISRVETAFGDVHGL